MKRSGLGRGLDALFSDEAQQPLSEGPSLEVAINDIDPNPRQPRKRFDEQRLTELAESISRHGVLQPVLLVRRGERYMLVTGERRWRASRIAGLRTVPAVVRELDENQILAVSLVENLQRDDLNPLEEAEGMHQLMTRFGMTQEDVAERIGRSRPAVANALRLLTLPESIRDLVAEGRLSAGHARCLAALENPSFQRALAERTLEKELSVRQLENLARVGDESALKPGPDKASPVVYDAVERLERIFGTRVKARGSLSRGNIAIHYYSYDDMVRLFDILFTLDKRSDN